MLRLRVKAPFAAFRTFTAGAFRPTAPFVTPSAAYGLVLNVAGIDSRFDDGKSAATLMRTDLPDVEVALGAVHFPEVQSVYQQLHNYPVGTTGKDRAAECKGNKYNIQPIRREFLSGLDAYICLRGNEGLEAMVREGLSVGIRNRRTNGRPRYGIPFLGDNSFTVDVLREESDPEHPAFWYVLVGRQSDAPGMRRCRLTLWIDRGGMAGTVSAVFVPTVEPVLDPPEAAWTMVGPVPAGGTAT